MIKTALILPFMLIPLALGCGGSGSSDSAGTNGDGNAIQVVMGEPTEFTLTPAQPQVSSGKVVFEVTNNGSVVHEMVIVKTDTPASDLGDSSGEADETGAVGEVSDLPPGKSETLTVDLAPGHYALVCNLPGHYEGGMFADFEVT